MTDLQVISAALSKSELSSIVVVGDYALDKYLYIDPARDEPSLETGLTAYQIHGKRMSAGAGGNVVSNLRALGAQVTCISLVGDDGEGYELLRCLKDIGANTDYMVHAADLCTCTYTKPMRLQSDGSWQEMNRLDFRNFAPPSMEVQRRIIENLEKCLPHADAVLVVDQFCQRNLGTITDYVRRNLNRLAQEHPEVIFFVDSRAFSNEFRNMIVKCNNHELTAMTGNACDPEDPEALRQEFADYPNLLLRDQTEPPLEIWTETDEDSLEGVYFGMLRKAMEESPEQARKIRLAAEISRKLLSGREVKL